MSRFVRAPSLRTHRLPTSGAKWLIGVVALAALVSPGTALEAERPSSNPSPRAASTAHATASPDVAQGDVFELTLHHGGEYANPFFDVSVSVVIRAPTGVYREVRGFYDGDGVWKARWRPDAPGEWTYAYDLTGPDGVRAPGVGAFNCAPHPAVGPLRRNPTNRFGWIVDTGDGSRAYFPLGVQDCFPVSVGPWSTRYIDGSERPGEAKRVTLDEYFTIYGAAGFNLFRFSQRNCSYSLFDDLDHYRLAEIRATDDLLATARAHSFRVMFGFFGFYEHFANGPRPMRGLTRLLRRVFGLHREAIRDPGDVVQVAKEQRFVDYCIARWGVYADVWELLNERWAADEWTVMMAEHVHSVDSDRKPVATSFERPELPAIDVNAPHWYESEDELDSDLRVQQKAAEWKIPGKPVIVGEQGNTGMNWDPRSAIRLRIRAWTALFEEISFVFWNTVWSKRGMPPAREGLAANIYLGPEERASTRVLAAFAAQLDADARPTAVDVSKAAQVRAYALVSDSVAGAYLHHFTNHTTAVSGVTITLDLPGPGQPGSVVTAQWIDPSTGQVLARIPVPPLSRTLEAPPFTIDAAVLVTGEPDLP